MSDPTDDRDAAKKPGKAGKAADPFALDDLESPGDGDFPDFASSASDDAFSFEGGDDLPPLSDAGAGSLDDLGSLDDFAAPAGDTLGEEGLGAFADEPLSPMLETPAEPTAEAETFAGFSMDDQPEPEAEAPVDLPVAEPADAFLADTPGWDVEATEVAEAPLAALGDEGAALSASEAPSDDFSFGAEPEMATLDEGADAFASGEGDLDLGGGLELDEAAEEFPLSAIKEDAEAAWPEDSAETTLFGDEEEAGEPGQPRVRKYMFDTSFDPLPEPVEEPVAEVVEEEEIVVEEPDPEPEPPPPPPPPTFTENELAEACERARAAGEAAGIAATQASINAQFAGAAQSIGAVLPGLMSDREVAVQHLSEEAARLAVALVAKALPELNRRYGVGEIEAIVKSGIALAVDQPRIIIRVASDLASGLSREFETLAQASGYQGRIIVLGDAALGPADVRIDWGDGGAERLAQKVWGELAAIVERAVGHLEQTAPVAERPAAADDIGSAA